MLQASFSGKAAALAQQKRLDVIANNVANASTQGFRASRVTFQDTLYTNMQRPIGGTLLRGTGMRVASTDYVLTPGSALETGNQTDLCITQNAYFSLENNNGGIQYTRNGAFSLSVQADGRYLVSAQGYHVLDENGSRIKIPQGDLSDLHISENGEMFWASESQPFAKLGMVTFQNRYGLTSDGNNLYSASAASGEAQQAQSPGLMQGYLESSNVDLAQEITLMIRTQRAFSLVSRALTTADEMEAQANNLRT